MANKILISLQYLVSCFLKPPANRLAAVGATEGLWQGLHPSVSWRLHCLLHLTNSCQAGEGSSALNLLYAKDQANENCGHRSGIYFPQVVKGIPQHVFFSTPFSSCPSLPLSMALFTKYWAGHHLSISESCVWNHLSKIGTQTHVAGTGRDSVLCLVTQSWAQPKPMVPGFRA